jgi:hypothetical protein
VFDLFRITFNVRPLPLVCVISVVVAVLLMLFRGRIKRTALLRRCLAVLLAAGTVVYLSVLTWYSTEPHFFDNAEPTVIANAWLLHLGQPVYHAVDAAARYSHIYGPLSFEFYVIAFRLFGPSILGAKALSAGCAVGSLALLLFSLSRRTTLSRAAVLTGFAAWWLLGFQQKSYWTRPEPFELLAVTIVVWLAIGRRRRINTMAIGLSVAVLLNLKFTGPLYALPAIAFVAAGTPRRFLLPAVVVTVLSAIGPFVLVDGVRWTNYRAWIELSGSTGLLFGLLHQNVDCAIALLLVPFVAYHAAGRPLHTKEQQWLVFGLCAGLSLVVVAAAKPGAGPYHLIPFVPAVVWLAADYLGDRILVPGGVALPALASALTFAVVAIAVAQTAQFVSVMQPRRARHEIADMLAFSSAHRGTVAMGYGSDESMSLERPALIFRTGINLIDQPAVREYQMQGLSMPPATLEAIGGCAIEYWLVPRGELPFSGRNSYRSVLGQPLYPEAFRTAFLRSHRIVAETEYYDVWQCRRRDGR